MRRRASAVRAPLLDRGGAGAVRRRAFRRLGRDRDPADAPERRALQLLGDRRSASGPIRTATAISATTTTTAKLVAALKDPVFRDYLTALEKKKGKAGGAAHPRSAALEFQHLSERLADEPIPAASRGASDRGQPHRGAHLQLPAEGRAGADVPQHHQLRQHRQRHRLAGADRRPGNLQPHRHGAFERRRRMAADRPRLPERRARRARRPRAASTRPARSTSATCSTPGWAT